MQLSKNNYKRIVIKIGSSLFCLKKKLDFTFIRQIAGQIAALRKEGKELVLVSSGAIALGMSLLKLASRPKDLSYLQAVAAIGQNELMNVYRSLFSQRSLHCGQVLLTWEDFNSRKRYLNAKNTLNTLLKLGTIPIINENDTISTDEIKLGDNDRLSALVSSLISADLLIMLSDIDGLLDKDKKTVIRVIARITPAIRGLASPTDKCTSVGGMITKLEAAQIAVDSGVPCVIANGQRQNIIPQVVEAPQKYGTLFLPQKNLPARARWIAFGTKPKGKIMVDEGAKLALCNRKSLLCVGVVGLEGNFDASDIVSITDKENCEFARGKVNLSSKQLEKAKGLRFTKEVIHCDNIVIL